METAKLCRASTTHAHHNARHPMHKHESELPSSLNKRTPTPTRANIVYPSTAARARRVYQQYVSDNEFERDADTTTDVYSFHAGKYWKCWCVWMRRWTNLAYGKPAMWEWDRNYSSHPLYIPSWYRSAAVPFDRSSGRWSFKGYHLIFMQITQWNFLHW